MNIPGELSDYVFTLMKLMNTEDEYLLVRTSYKGFTEDFKTDFPNSSLIERLIEFEFNKCENIVNAFIESKYEKTDVDVEFLIRSSKKLPEDKIFYSEKGKIPLEIYCQQMINPLIFDSKNYSNISKDNYINCYFITENDYEKAKRNWINLFK